MNVIYVRADGSIAKKVTNANVIEEIEGITAVVINEPCRIANNYYSDGKIIPKQNMVLDYQDGEVGESIAITGIPDGAKVTWPDGIVTKESGSLSFDSNAQGAYVFKIYHPAYYLKRVTINVT